MPAEGGDVAGQVGTVSLITPLLPGPHDHSEIVRFIYTVRLNLPGDAAILHFQEHQLQPPAAAR